MSKNGAEPFEQQQFGTAGTEGVKALVPAAVQIKPGDWMKYQKT